MTDTFKWEEAYTEGINIRTVLQEDELGSVENAVRQIILAEKRQRQKAQRPQKIRLGMIRYVYIGIDLSAAMFTSSINLTILKEVLLNFVNKFFELNPLSSLGIVVCREKRAERICGLTSSIQQLKESLLNISEATCSGEFSLYSMLESALQSFQNLPIHSSKECVFFIPSLSTIDAINLKHIYEQFKMRSIRGSIISFSAEVFAFKKLCKTTQGKYGVALDKEHLCLLLDEHVQPQPVKREQNGQQKDNIVRMGFPQRKRVLLPSFCSCHELSNDFGQQQSSQAEFGDISRAFFCPQCGARYCQTPVQCKICDLLLLTAPQLARAHQHLEPLPAFVESTPVEDTICFCCDEPIPTAVKAYKCSNCNAGFCIDCDIILHESLQVCPSCG